MKFTDIFVRRPVLALVVNLVIIIAGLQAVGSLNVRQYPKLESATVTVRTAYIGPARIWCGLYYDAAGAGDCGGGWH
jgi:multidrug efflux pump subunit AcrB